MNDILWWLIQSTLTTTVLAGIVALLCLGLGRRPAVQHVLWLVLLIKFVTPPVVDWPWSIGNLGGDSNTGASSVWMEPGNKPVARSEVALSLDLAASESPIFHPAVASETGVSTAEIPPTTVDPIGRLILLVLVAWSIGTLLMVFRQARAISRLLHVAGNAETAPRQFANDVGEVAAALRVRSVPVFVSQGIVSPFVLCWGRLRLLWPGNLPGAGGAYRSVIAHELAHVKRRDHWVSYLELVATCIWWWNPVFWFVRRQLRESADMACDAMALENMPRHRKEYAELFLELCYRPNSTDCAAQALGMSARGRRSTQRRLAMMMSDNVTARLSPRGIAFAIVLALLALPNWSIAQTANQDGSAPIVSPATETADRDTDGDGLSDFQEQHKYLTDPRKRDSDGDGVSDNDWRERREYAYTVRSIVRVMQPCGKSALSDDFQDARILDETEEYVELEVVHYPLATSGTAITENKNWQRDYAGMTEYLRPRINTNWDEKMRADLRSELNEAGIDVDALSDKQAIERVANWFTKTYEGLPMFNALHVHYPEGKIAVIPGREASIGLLESDWSFQKQFERELLGRDMFYSKTRGSCTSSAMGLTTVLRAIGIPTRMVLAIPIVDGSDEDQVAKLEHLSHHRVRSVALDGVSGLGNSFASHTYNEVFVGGRWHRLNYNRLGQPILDKHMFGLVTHVHSFNDLSEWGLQPTWGDWYAASRRTRVFAHNNPYATLAVTDRFGRHATIPNPSVHDGRPSLETFTMSRAYWFDSPTRPRSIPASAVANDGSGHILVHVDEPFDIDQFVKLYKRVDKRFTLRADGKADVPLRAERGHWNSEFYLRIRPDDFAKMAAGVPYRLVAASSQHWKVNADVTLVKGKESTQTPPSLATNPQASGRPGQLTITRAYWFHSKDRPSGIKATRIPKEGSGHILVHVADTASYKETQRIYKNADKRFVFRASGKPDVPARAELGNWGSEFYLRITPRDFAQMAKGEAYKLVALNGNPSATWKVESGVTLTKTTDASPEPDADTEPAVDTPDQVTLIEAHWADSVSAPDWIRRLAAVHDVRGMLLIKAKPPITGSELKAFTKVADRRFVLRSDEGTEFRIDAGVGCYRSGENCAIIVQVPPAALSRFNPDVRYRIIPRNEQGRPWDVKPDLKIQRRGPGGGILVP